MVDIARLGFSADTTGLDAATAKLNKLVPAAKTAEAGIKGFVAAVNGVSGATGSLNAAAAGMDKLGKSSLMAGTAMGTVKSAAAGASAPLNAINVTATRQAGMLQTLGGRWSTFLDSLRRTPAAANAAKSSLDRLGAAANDNINMMQSTPGNIAAQFQDIGVTAAGGMSPLIIGLQQGTQLSAALAGGMGNLIDALRQVFSMTALLTIGLVSLVAYLIQMADWAAIAKSALELLAGALQAAAPYALALGAVLLVAFAPQIIAMIYSMVVAIGTALVTAVSKAIVALIALAAANPFAALILGVAALVAAFVYFGVVTVEQVKKPINFIIAGFVGAFNTVKKTWSMLPAAIGDSVIQAANATLRGIEDMVNGAIKRINGLVKMLPFGLGDGLTMGSVSFGKVGNPYAGSAEKVGGIAKGEMAAAQGVDYVGKAQSAVVAGVNFVVDKIKGLAAGIGAGKDDKKDKKGGSDSAASGKQTEAEKQAEAFDKLKMSTESYIASKNSETAAIGLGARAAAELKHQTDLTNQAIQQGIPLDQARKKSIGEWAAAMADADVKLANAQGFDRLKTTMAGVDADLKAQMDQVGMTAEQIAKYKYEVVWLNDALASMTEATPAQITALRQFAEGAAASEIKLISMRKAADDLKKSVSNAREGAKSFIDDMRTGLERGKGFWGSFTSAVMGMLDRMIDKLIDFALKAAFPDDGKGGLFAGITKLFGAVSGVPTPTAKLGTKNNAVAFAKGGVFGESGIVNSPTLFKFAKGTGLMGEAGPEAIMPLKRGSDGSLGVMMHGARGGGGSQEVNVTVSTSKYLVAEIDNRAGAVAAPLAARAAVGGAAIAQDKIKRRNRNRIPS